VRASMGVGQQALSVGSTPNPNPNPNPNPDPSPSPSPSPNPPVVPDPLSALLKTSTLVSSAMVCGAMVCGAIVCGAMVSGAMVCGAMVSGAMVCGAMVCGAMVSLPVSHLEQVKQVEGELAVAQGREPQQSTHREQPARCLVGRGQGQREHAPRGRG
jgi:hypothetical protein